MQFTKKKNNNYVVPYGNRIVTVIYSVVHSTYFGGVLVYASILGTSIYYTQTLLTRNLHFIICVY